MQSVRVIAELSGNHNGSLARAKELLHAAKEAGADLVKLQTYTPDTMTVNVDVPWLRIKGGPWDGWHLYDLYKTASTPWEWHEELYAESRRLGLPCLSTPFDSTAVAFLESLGNPIYKIASFEIIDLPLLTAVARTKKPVILSTGMATLAEIDQAVQHLRQHGTTDLTLLACLSAYPARPEDLKLRNIAHLSETFGCPAGLSDHSPGHAAASAAVALGATVIEKHLTLRRADGGPDSSFSMEPEEFAALVRAVREVESAMNHPVAYGPTKADQANIVFRRSVFVVQAIQAGEVFTEKNLRIIRPGYGLAPALLPQILGRKAVRDVSPGTPLAWDLVG
jgi:pseudaminic acid synthase